MLSLGSSLTVTPAANLCEQVGDESLDGEPMDALCSQRISAKIELVGLMRKLELDIPE